jgi:hypothetical protein
MLRVLCASSGVQLETLLKLLVFTNKRRLAFRFGASEMSKCLLLEQMALSDGVTLSIWANQLGFGISPAWHCEVASKSHAKSTNATRQSALHESASAKGM